MKKATHKKHKTIFVVEDDTDIAELIELVLTQKGYCVSVFHEGKTALDRLRGEHPNLIIMDVWMPGLDGITLTDKLKSKKSTGMIPIVLVSARTSLEKISRQTGADGFLPKPFDIKKLLATVKKFIH